MKKNEILENILIDKLIFGGKWLALAPDGKKIIVTGGVIPGSRVNLRILKSRTNYYEAQILDTVQKSPLEQDLPAHFQVYGGCKWLPIAYPEQLRIKEEQVREAFHGLQKFWNQPSRGSQKWWSSSENRETEWVVQYTYDEWVSQIWAWNPHFSESPIFHPIVPSPEIYGYRNKVEFSWGKYISFKEDIRDEFRFGFHAQGQFDRIIDCTYCVLADEEINEIFKEVDRFSRNSGLPTYDPKTNIGFWRHFVVRKARFTDEIMLIFSVNDMFLEYTKKDGAEIIAFAEELMVKFPHIVSVYLLRNSGRADVVTGEAVLLKGKATIIEHLLNKSFEINPKSFFQTNSLGAEKLYQTALDLSSSRWGVLLDLYAGTGTLGILFSDRFEQVYSVELVPQASQDGKKNARRNGIANIEFVNAKVEVFLEDFLGKNLSADTLIIDPPRDGMHPNALPNILKFGAREIIYISCNPATLARDLDYILANSDYHVTDVTPVDMFPHTHHIETVVRLER